MSDHESQSLSGFCPVEQLGRALINSPVSASVEKQPYYRAAPKLRDALIDDIADGVTVTLHSIIMPAPAETKQLYPAIGGRRLPRSRRPLCAPARTRRHAEASQTGSREISAMATEQPWLIFLTRKKIGCLCAQRL
jgi:hypothetical protein